MWSLRYMWLHCILNLLGNCYRSAMTHVQFTCWLLDHLRTLCFPSGCVACWQHNLMDMYKLCHVYCLQMILNEKKDNIELFAEFHLLSYWNYQIDRWTWLYIWVVSSNRAVPSYRSTGVSFVVSNLRNTHYRFITMNSLVRNLLVKMNRWMYEFYVLMKIQIVISIDAWIAMLHVILIAPCLSFNFQMQPYFL